MSSIKRVVKNTGYLYMKMIISMVISLYSVRLILNALGAEDYGIYNLIAGVVAMLSFLNASMTVSSQRYLSFYLGAGDTKKLKKVFQSSLVLHIIIGLVGVLALEIAGLFIFDGFLNIPEDRMWVAKFVFHAMVVSLFFTINAVPYDAVINAHEDLLFDAIVGIVESFIKLGIAIWILYYSKDKLLLYAVAMALSVILVRIIKSIFSNRRYYECSLGSIRVDKSLFKEMISFAGWNTFGAACGIMRNQGLAIVLNIFYGTTINATYGIATQINGQIKGFAENMLKSIRPQIIKAEGEGSRKEMLKLSLMASKYGFFLLFFIVLPLIFEMNYVLKLWLKNVPDNTVIFCQLILLLSLVNMLTIGLQTAIQATGKIKIYQAIVGGVILLTPIAAYIGLFLGGVHYSVIIVAVLIEGIACVLRLFFVKKFVGLSIKYYVKEVIIPIIFLTSAGSIGVSVLHLYWIEESFLRLIVTGILSSLLLIGLIYQIDLKNNENINLRKLLKR